MKKAELKELKGPDAFQRFTLSVSHKMKAYTPLLVAAALILVVAGIGWTAFQAWSSRAEETAQVSLYKAEREYLKKKSTPPMGEKNQAQPDYTSDVTALQGLIQSYPNSKAAVLAALDLADIYTQMKQLPQALEIMQKVGQKLAPNELLYGVRLMKVASLEAAQNDCKAALDHFAKVLQSDRQTFFHAEATLRSAVCAEMNHDLTRAKALYQQTVEKFPESAAGQSAQRYLRLLESQPQPGQS